MTELRSGRVGTGTATPVPAATVVLLRDPSPGSDEGMEVFLQERTLASDFAGGALVFPGGKVDPRDADLDPDVVAEVDAPALQRRLGTQTQADAIALAVAAVRETFEEACVLLARRDGRLVDDDFLARDHAVAVRGALSRGAGQSAFHDWLAAHELRLDLAALHPLAWWITPHGVHRRFSTRFFVAQLPSGQARSAGHDGGEMIDSTWLGPGAALAAGERGDRTIIYPTRMTLAALARFDSVAAVLAAAAAGDVDLRPIVPLLRPGPDGLGVQHPDGGPVEPV